MNKEIISWDKFEKDMRILSKKIFEKGGCDKILCVTKGGMIPAYYLARDLNIKHIETINISSYNENNEKKTEVFLKSPREIDDRRGWLIVDDLVDSGDSIELVKKYYPNAKSAVVYMKSSSKVVPDFFVEEMDDFWIVFPWE